MIKTIIFDLEGVVIDTEPLWDSAQRHALASLGRDYERANTKHLLSGRSTHEAARILSNLVSPPVDPHQLQTQILKRMKHELTDNLSYADGFLAFFQQAENHVQICLATSMDEDLLEHAGRPINLSGLFRGNVFTLKDVSYAAKPNPDLFLFAARAMNTEPAMCVVIEDAPLGIEASHRAGMPCVAVESTFPREVLEAAEIVVPSLMELDLARVLAIKRRLRRRPKPAT